MDFLPVMRVYRTLLPVGIALGVGIGFLGSTFTMNIITIVVLGGTLSTGGKGNVFGTVLATIIIGLIKFGLPLCFGINSQYLDAPIGILLVVVLLGRALMVHPAFINYRAKLKNKRQKAA